MFFGDVTKSFVWGTKMFFFLAVIEKRRYLKVKTNCKKILRFDYFILDSYILSIFPTFANNNIRR